MSSFWETMRTAVDSLPPEHEAGKQGLDAAIDFAELLVWWGNVLSGAKVSKELAVQGISIQPQREGSGLCMTVRAKVKKQPCVGFHFAAAALPGLADLRHRIEAGSMTWRVDSPVVRQESPDAGTGSSEKFNPDRLTGGQTP